jgi:hypothetical protein
MGVGGATGVGGVSTCFVVGDSKVLDSLWRGCFSLHDGRRGVATTDDRGVGKGFFTTEELEGGLT